MNIIHILSRILKKIFYHYLRINVKSLHHLSQHKYPIYFHLEKNEKNICSSYKDNDKNIFSDTCQALTSATVEYKDNIKKLCEDIIKLFCTLPERDENNNIRDNYLKFLNFWFNRELKKLITDKITRSSVYSHFNSLCSKVKDLNELKNNINEIDDVQYDKWCVLYELYDNYNKIINECIKKRNDLQNKCTKYYQEVVDLFNKGINYFNENSDYEFNNSMKELNFLYSKFKQEKNFQKIIKQKELKELGFVSDSKKKKVPNVDVICKSLSDADKIRSVNINSEYGVILENTPAQKIYKNFYKENIDESSCIKYCDALISENVDNNKDARICAKIVTNLKKLPNIKDVGDTHEDRCSNLTYWTYDILMKEFNTNKNVIVDNNIISELNNAIFRANSELKKDENCTYYIDGTFTEWTEEKNLHDYFENYSTFIKNITDNGIFSDTSIT
ncbi:hypothetical protein PVBG_04749 [Plasmodium vivax Brazil I]|uniref:PIR Superfamily Protein n=1 Tax=Plasmodium vivax (strain Brazil I) TaxID=1033975 RepID=A0A0J9SZH8_PLAV1|nr:hypothetical protein PVBG_04749 [Plasmodium vivax Brazil I]